MKAVLWISESNWEACVDQARKLLPGDADLTLVHVTPGDVEELAGGGGGLLGRHPPPPPGPPVRAIAAEEAEELLATAAERLGRPARRITRRGRVEHELLEACRDADLLLLARDGEPRAGPKSLGPQTRFVLDHAPCQVLLVWAERPSVPPHLRA